jgi:hypothetical protein
MLPVFQTNVSKRLKAPTGGARTPLRAAAGNGVPALPIKSYAFAPMLLTFPYQMAKLQLQGRRETNSSYMLLLCCTSCCRLGRSHKKPLHSPIIQR